MPQPGPAAQNLPILRDLPGHNIPVPFMLTGDMFGGIPVELAGAEISGLVDRPVADTHVHEVPEIYLLFAPQPGDAEIDVEIDGETFTVLSPGAVYVPAGARHRFVTRRAVPGSFCYGLFLNGTGPGGAA